ncbi:MAG: site-specific integrase [Provencibacterium sp.]|jgi:integrase|nr:site-specific integrase [Provencibacterium sp.]
MSVTKDKNGKWMSQIRVRDWTGKEIHKKKRGFPTKREALQWEHAYISQADGSLGMGFKDFIELYMQDMGKRLKASTVANKHFLIDLKITPFFGRMPLNEIKPTHIRQWQNQLSSYCDENGRPYSQTYLKTIHNQLTAIFNYAVKYYGLKENPCHKAGSMGKKNAGEMSFWTKEEFAAFIEAVKDKPASYAIFMTLYYTGIREGELLALTPADIDLGKSTLRVNKSYQRLGGEDVVSSPKTPKSNRVIPIPEKLCDCLRVYMGQCYGLQENDRLFPYAKYFLSHEMERGCKRSGVKRIRIHQIRHSHASLLVEMGVSPLLIAERLGHERIQTTMETYSHLYPNKQAEVARQLDGLMPES